MTNASQSSAEIQQNEDGKGTDESSHSLALEDSFRGPSATLALVLLTVMSAVNWFQVALLLWWQQILLCTPRGVHDPQEGQELWQCWWGPMHPLL